MRANRDEYQRFSATREDTMYSAHRRPCKRGYPQHHWMEDFIPPFCVGVCLAVAVYLLVTV